MATEFQQWLDSIPPITKFLFLGSAIITIMANFSLINPMLLILDFDFIFKKFQLWRIVTAFLFHGKLGFGFLFAMSFLYRYGIIVEQQFFGNVTADFATFIGFCGGVQVIVALLWGKLPILGMGIIMSIIYYWSRKAPISTINLMFIPVQTNYLPWALVAFNFLMGGKPYDEILGIFVCHLYLMLAEIWPKSGGPALLKTPNWMYHLFPQGAPQHVFGGMPRGMGNRLG